MKRNEKYSFEKGWSQRRVMDEEIMKSEIMAVLRINNRNSWYGRLKGYVIPRVDEKEAIDAIFAARGITEVWGGLEQNNI
jgi:hypothetical protein